MDSKTHYLLCLVLCLCLCLCLCLGGVDCSRKELKTSAQLQKKNELERILRETPPSNAPAPAPSPTRSPRKSSNSSNTVEKTPQRHKKPVPAHKWAYGITVGIVAGVFSAGLSFFLVRLILFYAQGRPKIQTAKIYSNTIKKAEHLAFLEKEDGLSSAIVIGRGGSGEVYKASLEGGKEIAIKKIIQPNNTSPHTDLSSTEDSKLLDEKRRSIKAELDTLGRVKHKNLVTLLAYIPRPDCHLLVYEYMSNGSLQDALMKVRDRSLELAWPVRYRIALGIASALEYLHFQNKETIIHRDLKPANILLDENFDARVADFGLAKALPEFATHATTSNVAGTVGYIAPEYHQTLKFTDKCDVYSFGVVLTFLFTGRQPCDDFFQSSPQGSISITSWLRNIVASEVVSHEAIDPTLVGQGYDEAIFLMLKIACFCTYEDPFKRPNSRDVLTMIHQINPQLS